MKLKNKIEKKKIPKISIITPVLNGDKYLEKCIKSVVKQSYPKKKLNILLLMEDHQIILLRL